jgi:hypothetical protein
VPTAKGHEMLYAPLAQLAEQLTLNQRVRGSSPWRRTNVVIPKCCYAMTALRIDARYPSIAHALGGQFHLRSIARFA